MTNFFRAFVAVAKLSGVVLFLGTAFLCLLIFLPFIKKLSFSIARFIYKTLLAILNVRVHVRGDVASSHVVYVSNHTSFLDILVLGSVLNAAFVSKAEVERWPVVGRFAKVFRTVFIDRKKRSLDVQSKRLEDALNSGVSLILFPEGTSNDGVRVLPFKSSLFEVLNSISQKNDVMVVPVSIAYQRRFGLLNTRALRMQYAWFGDMDVLTHLWFVAKSGRLDVVVKIADHVSVLQHDNRKELCDVCFKAVRENFELIRQA